MSETKLTKIQFRQDTAANWTSNNPILNLGEPAIETDTNYFKIGNGETTWSNLPYQTTPNAAVIPECPDTGLNYSRTRNSGNLNGAWEPSIENIRKINYNTETDLNCTYKDSSGTNREIYAIKKSFSISINASVLDNKLVQSNVNSILAFGGTFQYDSTHIAVLPTYTNKWNANVVLDNEDNTVMLETFSDVSRTEAIADIWILYTKI